jgi:hypothetical protein
MKKLITAGVTAAGIGAASFALAVLNPFNASAQESPTTTEQAPSDQTTPTNPTDPGQRPPHQGGDKANCPNMGGDSGTSGTTGTSGTATQTAFRGHHGPARF